MPSPSQRPAVATSVSPGRGSSGAEDGRSFASPACAIAEAAPAYMGYLPPAELVERLNRLLEAERAGARVLTALRRDHPDITDALAGVHRDEARYAALLTKLVRGLGGEPSRKTGDFVGKVLALDSLKPRLELLNRGQGWVAKRLDEILPRIADDAIHAPLREMRDRHHENIASCTRLVERL